MNIKFRPIANLLSDKRKKISIDEGGRIDLDSKIILEKPEFASVVNSIQHLMFSQFHSDKQLVGNFIELGAGALPMKKLYKQIKSTDIVESPHLDGVLDATNLDLPDSSVDGIFLQNTFHHIPDPVAFFDEANRVLKQNGKVVIVDPYWNFFSSMLYPRLFRTESYDKTGTWNDASTDPMIGANQALSYIVFQRDLAIFERNVTNLSIEAMVPLRSGLRYFLTGGLNFRKLLPSRFFPFLAKVENRIPLLDKVAIH